MNLLDDFSEMADVVSRIQDRPQVKDWFAVAMKSGSVGMKLHDRVTRMRATAAGRELRSWRYLSYCGVAFSKLLSLGRIAPDPDRTGPSGLVPHRLDGQYDLMLNIHLSPPEFAVRPADVDEIKRVVRDFIWSEGYVVRLPTPRMTTAEPPGIQRACEVNFAARVRKYYNAGEHRAFLLTGLPGTGKTESALRIAYAMKLRTFYGAASRLDSEDFGVGLASGAEALIIDDLDWSKPDNISRELAALSALRQEAKVIFVTANRIKDIPAPMLRPGRIDEIVLWPGCTKDELTVLGAPAACEGWPIAFVQEVCTRLRVEGHVDLEEVKSRIGEEPSRRVDHRVPERSVSNGVVIGQVK